MDWKAQLSYYFSARTYRATDLATPRAFRANPSLVWEFYHHRREGMAAVEPNPVKRRLFLINSDPKKSLKMLPKSPYQEKTPKTVSNLCLEWNYLFRSSIVFTQDKKDLNFASFPLFHILYFVICTSLRSNFTLQFPCLNHFVPNCRVVHIQANKCLRQFFARIHEACEQARKLLRLISHQLFFLSSIDHTSNPKKYVLLSFSFMSLLSIIIRSRKILFLESCQNVMLSQREENQRENTLFTITLRQKLYFVKN